MTKKGKGKDQTLGDEYSPTAHNSRLGNKTALTDKRHKRKMKTKDKSHISDLKGDKKEEIENQKCDVKDNASENEDKSDENEVDTSNKNDKACESGVNKKVKTSKKGNPYILFVGNLSYKATPELVKKHFEKAGSVKEVRIPTDKNTNKQRGFAYVQLNDRLAYEKALTLHHTRILGRSINVEYTTQGKKGGPKEEKIKQKNLKLRALSKVGILPTISKSNKVKKKKKNKRKIEESEKNTPGVE